MRDPAIVTAGMIAPMSSTQPRVALRRFGQIASGFNPVERHLGVSVGFVTGQRIVVDGGRRLGPT
jgi:anaerobic glycerol-3-phosphate dehydrogenase